MKAKDNILKTLQESKRKIMSYGIKSVGIFGSFATSSQGKTSGINILIEFQKDKKAFDNYMELPGE